MVDRHPSHSSRLRFHSPQTETNGGASVAALSRNVCKETIDRRPVLPCFGAERVIVIGARQADEALVAANGGKHLLTKRERDDRIAVAVQ